jgi:methylenetetrahydrofolate dehydrogenase (NADP+)/methenyltetrahydrofolate cyclohydrolase
VARAEIVVAAIGKAELVKGAWIREGAVVIDVGMNRLPDGRLVGDVEYAAAAARAAAITPVPGGVGPMTRAMLLVNTIELARKRAR